MKKQNQEIKRKQSLICILIIFAFQLLVQRVSAQGCGNIPIHGSASTYLSAQPNFFLNVTTQTYDVTGTFYIDVNTILTNCIFYMESGSEIIVTSAFTSNCQFTLDNSSLEKCTDMWKGITVEAGSSIKVLNQSFIQDANIAIYLNDETQFQLEDSYFFDNVIGVYTPVNPLDAINNITGSVANTEFVLNGGLGNLYPTQLPHGILPYAGMVLNNMVITIGDNSKISNLFGELNIGIYSYNSVLDVTNSTFRRIEVDPAYGNSPYDGSCICALGGLGLFTLTVNPITIPHGSPFFTTEFTACDFGVFTSHINARVYNCDFQGAGTGVFSTRCSSLMTTIVRGCNINASHFGINYMLNEGSGGMNASANDITMQYDKYGVGINMQDGTNTITSNYNVFDNRIEVIEATCGIRCMNALTPAINYNVIQQTNINTFPAFYGIDIADLDRSIFKCNSVLGSGANGAAGWGIRAVSMNTRTYMHCNHVQDLTYGVEFDGPNPGTDFKSNSMTDHQEGLHLNSNAIIDPQIDAGNTWNGTFSSGNGAVNFNSSAPPYVALNRFEVNTSIGTSLHPVNYVICSGCQWFVQTGGSPWDCDRNHIECYGYLDGGEDERVTVLDREIAQGNINTMQWQDESRFMVKQYLYDKLSDNDSLLQGDTLMEGFYNNLSGSVNEQLKITKDATAALFAYDQYFQSVAHNNDSIIDTLRTIISANEQLIVNNDPSSSTLEAENILLRSELQDAMDAVRILTDQRETLKQTQVNLALAANAEIITTETVATNEQLINDIYFQTIAVNNYTFTTQQVSDLLSVAQQCPYAGGKAVIQARIIYSLINDSIHYDDSTACLLQGIYRLQEQQAQTELQLANAVIKPNPARETATIAYLLPETSTNSRFELFDFTGRSCFNLSLPCNKKELTFSTSTISNGMYIYKVISSNSITSTGKFIVSK